ncbi:MAG: hypothetical protein ACKOF9_10315 [Burkholderiales bacterium]
MLRCLLASFMVGAVALPAIYSLTAHAQIQFERQFPQEALRGELTFGQNPPEAKLGDAVTRLAPGARIRGQNNMMVMSDGLRGQTFVVLYTRDLLGQPKDIWILRPEEISRTPWPSTPEEAKTWRFNATTQIWTKP